LLEELSYFVYQKIGLEEYIYIKKQNVLKLVNEILKLKDKEVLEDKVEEVKRLFNEIQDTDDIFRFYENLEKIKQIVILSQKADGEKTEIDEKLFTRFEKLKDELETKLNNLETILD